MIRGRDRFAPGKHVKSGIWSAVLILVGRHFRVWCWCTIGKPRPRLGVRKKCCGINVIVSAGAGFSPYSQGHDPRQ
jgi:hypothetical protein